MKESLKKFLPQAQKAHKVGYISQLKIKCIDNSYLVLALQNNILFTTFDFNRIEKMKSTQAKDEKITSPILSCALHTADRKYWDECSYLLTFKACTCNLFIFTRILLITLSIKNILGKISGDGSCHKKLNCLGKQNVQGFLFSCKS